MIGDHAPVAFTTVLVRSRPPSPSCGPGSGPRRPRRCPRGARSGSTVCAHVDLGPALDRVDRVGDAEPRAVDPPLVEAEAAHQVAVQPRLELAELVGRQARVRLAALERLVVVVRLEEGVRRAGRGGARAVRSRTGQGRGSGRAGAARSPGCGPSRGTISRSPADRCVRYLGPPWIMPLELPLAPNARSLRSNRATLRPRCEASRATPTPFTPPPMTTTSTSVSARRAGFAALERRIVTCGV